MHAQLHPIPPMDHGSGHKPSAFTWAMGRLILQRMGARETMRQITADPRMPAYCTVFRWAQVIPEFGALYREVRCVIAEAARAEAEDLRALKAQIRANEIAARAAAKGKAPRHWKAGAKSTYTPEVAEAVCVAIAGGASMSEVVATPGMPTFKAVYGWMPARPEFREAYMAACDERAMGLRMRIDMAVDAATPSYAGYNALLREMAALEARLGRVRPKLYRRRELEGEGSTLPLSQARQRRGRGWERAALII